MAEPSQSDMISEAMKSIAERKPGRTKLVYDKRTRTIVAIRTSWLGWKKRQLWLAMEAERRD